MTKETAIDLLHSLGYHVSPPRGGYICVYNIPSRSYCDFPHATIALSLDEAKQQTFTFDGYVLKPIAIVPWRQGDNL